jgi:hypothetical protein
MVGEIFQLYILFFSKAEASLMSRGINPFVTAPLLFCPGLMVKVLPPRSSILASRALLALEPIPITAITAAVPIIIAREVRKDLIALVLIEVVAEIKDSLKSISRN